MNFEEKLDDIVAPALGTTLSIVSELALQGAAATIVPGVGNMILAYKQHRTEKNILEFIEKIVARQEELNKKFDALEPDKLEVIKKHYFGIVTDYVLNVRQKAKIDYLVNGYINLSGVDINKEDVVLLFFDVLDDLNILDIAILKTYQHLYKGKSLYEIMNEYDINQEQCKMINEKLCRAGLLDNKNDISRDKNIDRLSDYIEAISKGKKAKFKSERTSASSSYTITSFGNKFIDFFSKQI